MSDANRAHNAESAVDGPERIIAAQQREITMLRENCRLAADNVGDWRDLHQHWQADFLRAESAASYYDSLPGEGQEEAPTDWEYVAKTMRDILRGAA